MSMTMKGHKNLGGSRTVINPFMPGGEFKRITIEIDNSYNRGYIPPYSLWAPSDYGSSPKYMPYIPPIAINASASSYYDIHNEWHDYFRGGDEVIALDISKLAATPMNMAFFGLQGCTSDTDITDADLGTDTATVGSIGEMDSGGTGYTRITMTDRLDTDTGVATGVLGTGDVLVLAGSSTSTAIKAYQQADRVVILEQEFNFSDPIDGLAAGSGGIIVESAVYSYDGVVDQNHVQYFTYLNILDGSPALTACTRYLNGTRFNFANIYRG